jgi:hypothetical protein
MTAFAPAVGKRSINQLKDATAPSAASCAPTSAAAAPEGAQPASKRSRQSVAKGTWR